MLRNTYILSNQKIISKLFTAGLKRTVKPLTLTTIPFDKNKVLFAVSKKHIPKAVERNKIKIAKINLEKIQSFIDQKIIKTDDMINSELLIKLEVYQLFLIPTQSEYQTFLLL